MIVYRCDGCGRRLERHALRYTVKIDVQAAYDRLEVGLAELIRDHRAELLALIERLKEVPAQRLEETVYKGLTLDLCPSCQRSFIRNPLRFHPECAGESEAIDIDGFLRSLGFGQSESGEK